MEKDYRIGVHEFETEEEYKRAQKDYEQIQTFMKELDLRQPVMSLRLYKKLEASKHLMKTPVGEAFKEKLVQIFISKEIADKKKHLEEEESQSIQEIIYRARRARSFRWYWNSFRAVSLFQLFYLILTGFIKMRDVDVWLLQMPEVYRFWLVLGIYGKYVVAALLLGSLGLAGHYFFQQLRKVPGTVHRLNCLLISGTIMCIYLYLMVTISGGLMI